VDDGGEREYEGGSSATQGKQGGSGWRAAGSGRRLEESEGRGDRAKKRAGRRGSVVWSEVCQGLFCENDRPTSFPCRREYIISSHQIFI
jgi:hypothetical protein